MSNTLGKNLHHLCFSLTNSPKHTTKKHQHSLIPPPITTTTTFTKSYNSLFEDMNTNPASASSLSADTDTEMEDEAALGLGTLDLTAVYASRRFFISSPGRSNSIVDSRSTSSSPEDYNQEDEEEEPDTPSAIPGGVAVETYSPDPYTDFRRSMQEMMEAREVAREDVREMWHYLQELLLSYLSLNPKSIHKYIVRAFADLVASSMSPLTNNSNNGPSSSLSPYFSSYYGITNYSNNINSRTYVNIFDNAT